MKYSIEPRNFVKDFGFLSSFAKNMGKNIGRILSSKYSKKLLDHARQSPISALILIQKLNSRNSRKNWLLNCQ